MVSRRSSEDRLCLYLHSLLSMISVGCRSYNEGKTDDLEAVKLLQMYSQQLHELLIVTLWSHSRYYRSKWKETDAMQVV